MARGINKVILVGNLGKDPDIRYTASGAAIANITIATTESWRDKQSGEKQEKTDRIGIQPKLWPMKCKCSAGVVRAAARRHKVPVSGTSLRQRKQPLRSQLALKKNSRMTIFRSDPLCAESVLIGN